MGKSGVHSIGVKKFIEHCRHLLDTILPAPSFDWVVSLPVQRFRNRFSAWLTAFLMLAGACMPTISRAMMATSADGQAWVEVCTASGTRLIPSSLSDRDSGAPDQPGSESQKKAPNPSTAGAGHCPLCCGHAGHACIPSAEASLPALPLASDQVPTLFLVSPRPLFVWSSAQPRAPPLHI
ncbi:DUF2946 domain-containing protein [Zoogloea sp.]|uniref:DUF2946 domain-containing protein n=1 Tax=Zoogloea sp. TaxID=49181 RepID=UPI00262B7AC8|nr:DUF2946 domain-containing protein [Zoogloea sp.]MDD3354017.1 DUF2946 domain-containing protein [Zoogloea sp.]